MERKPVEKQPLSNGGVLTESSLPRHLVICVSPPGHSRRITPCSATRLLGDGISDTSSSWNSPISMKSVASKNSLPPMKLDLINFISDTKSVRSDKYKQAIKEFMEQEKANDEERRAHKLEEQTKEIGRWE